jgi:hypothetical protein
MIRLKILIVGLLLLGSGLGTFSVKAQSPKTVDVPYGSHILEVDPAQGPQQCLIVRRVEQTIEDLDGSRTEATVHFADILYALDEGWKVTGTGEWEAKGVWDLHAGDDCTGLGVQS